MEQFEEIYRNYFSRIYSFLYKLCGDRQLAEELSQETFFQAFSSFHRFKGRCDIFTWLAAIAKHTYYKYLRKNKLGAETISLDLVCDTFCRNTLGNPEETLQLQAVRDGLIKTVNKIPEKYRDVVILRVYAEMSFAQVGEAIGISENSAKVIFFRAKKMLMEEMKNEFEL